MFKSILNHSTILYSKKVIFKFENVQFIDFLIKENEHDRKN